MLNNKIKYLLILLVFCQNLNLKAMNTNNNESKLNREKINLIKNKVQEIIKNKNTKKKLDNLKNSKIQHLIEKVKDQNTILFRLGKFFAFYKGDVIRTACFSLDFLAEKALCNKIVALKTEHILNSIKADAKYLQEILNKILILKEHERKNYKQLKSSPEILEFKDYINKNHKFIRYNPFKLNLLPNFGLNLIKTRALNYIEDSFLVSTNNKNLLLRLEPYLSYEKDKDGNLKELPLPGPFSIATVIMHILNPTYFTEKTAQRASHDLLEILNNYFKLGIPKFVFSNTTKILSAIGAIGLSAKYTDNILNANWTEYAINNNKKFLKLIRRYNSMQKTTPQQNKEKLEKIEKKIKKFINKAIHPGWFSNNLWVTTKNLGRTPFQLAIELPVLGLLAYKAYKFYKENFA